MVVGQGRLKNLLVFSHFFLPQGTVLLGPVPQVPASTVL